MKIYELIIVKGGFIYDGDGYEQERTDDVEVKLYKTEQERDEAYQNLVDPYIKIQDFCKKAEKELREYYDLHPNSYRDAKLWDESKKKCAEFISKVGCDIKNCLGATIYSNEIYTYIDIELPSPCEGCECDINVCVSCVNDNPDVSPNQFYYIFKKETEI